LTNKQTHREEKVFGDIGGALLTNTDIIHYLYYSTFTSPVKIKFLFLYLQILCSLLLFIYFFLIVTHGRNFILLMFSIYFLLQLVN